LRRDNYRCTACGATRDLEVHHIVPRRLGGPDEPANLITLCAACHSRLHGSGAGTEQTGNGTMTAEPAHPRDDS
jgi:5-methylcytosine-specific restriction endonuclease McrA